MMFLKFFGCYLWTVLFEDISKTLLPLLVWALLIRSFIIYLISPLQVDGGVRLISPTTTGLCLKLDI